MGPAYPRNQREFDALVASEEACPRYLSQIRWPEGFVCPACGHRRARAVRSPWQECAGCGRQTSLTAGTMFQDTRSPLRTWFQAIWYVTGQQHGASALGRQRVLGLGSYHTAWAWLHRLRRAMVGPGRERLTGTVQVDESFWGGASTPLSLPPPRAKPRGGEHPGKRGGGAGGNPPEADWRRWSMRGGAGTGFVWSGWTTPGTRCSGHLSQLHTHVALSPAGRRRDGRNPAWDGSQRHDGRAWYRGGVLRQWK